jgi:hypothetical protein
MTNAYQEARLEGSQIHDRQTLAAYWLAKLQWFTDRLTDADPTVLEIVEACQNHYELHCGVGVGTSPA